jgi:excisionase family DNA binding protein
MQVANYPPLLSLSEAAELTGLSKEYLTKLRRNGVLKTYTLQGGDKGSPRYKIFRDHLLKHTGLS